MQVVTTFRELYGIHEPIHWAMGVFDGIHMGHQFVISSARQAKADKGGLLGVFTFDCHPLLTVHPGSAPRQIIADGAEKQFLLEQLGVDVLFNLHFDETISVLTAHEFLDELCNACKVASISIGEDWRFGKDRMGNTEMLEEEGKKRGFSVYVHPHVSWNGERISSTRIRKHIEEGDLESVRSMLGRPYTMSGEVIHGRQLGRQLGFPTANIKPHNEQTPPAGVYAVRAPIDNRIVGGVANLGIRPTLTDDRHELLLEVNLFDWSGDLYGKQLHVELVKYLRPEEKFQSLDQLKEQMAIDCAKAKEALA